MPLLSVLQDKQKISVAELRKVERVQKTSVSETVPQLLVKLGLCSELDVADAFVESDQFADKGKMGNGTRYSACSSPHPVPPQAKLEFFGLRSLFLLGGTEFA